MNDIQSEQCLGRLTCFIIRFRGAEVIRSETEDREVKPLSSACHIVELGWLTGTKVVHVFIMLRHMPEGITRIIVGLHFPTIKISPHAWLHFFEFGQVFCEWLILTKTRPCLIVIIDNVEDIIRAGTTG